MIIAGTGHRPDKLGGYSDQAFKRLVSFLRIQLVRKDPELVISGTALGLDFALLVAARQLGIKVRAAVPFEGFGSQWSPSTYEFWQAWINSCNEVVVLKDLGPEPERFSVVKALDDRNKYMVNESDRMFSLWNGTKGGTYNCIQYANKVRKPVDNYWTHWTRSRFFME